MAKYVVPIMDALPNKDWPELPERIRHLIASKLTNPPVVIKEFDEEEFVSALRQNGWRRNIRRYKGRRRIYLIKEF